MKTQLSRVILALALLAGLQRAAAQGTAFTYQGRLNDSGQPASGSYDLTFAVYGDSNGVSQVGGTLTNTATDVNNGLFTVTIDFGFGVFDGTILWLQLGAETNGASGGFSLLTPLQQLTPTPYAIYASNAGTANNAATAYYATTASGVTAGSVTSAGIAGGAVVRSLNTMQDAVTLSPGVNISITPSGAHTLTIAASSSILTGSSNAWGLFGNSGANPTNGYFIGTTDSMPLELRVEGTRVFRIEPGNTPGLPANVVGGTANGAVYANGATIGGGFLNTNYYNYATIGGGTLNLAAGSGSFIGGGGFDGSTYKGNFTYGPAGAATIGGGLGNGVWGQWGTVGGGAYNTTYQNTVAGTIAGGQNNSTLADNAAIGGGAYNQAYGPGSFIGGGGWNGSGYGGNSTYGAAATIGGGVGNNASGPGAFIGGGGWNGVTQNGNSASGPASTIGGGFGNTTSGLYANIGGGVYNTDSGFAATIGGGDSNTNNAQTATIAGGFYNQIPAGGAEAAIGGGYFNTASGQYATIPGGTGNKAVGVASFAAGTSASANDDYSFLWCDGTRAGVSQGAHSFSALATGGVWFFTGPYPAGIKLAPGASSWTTLSDRNFKKNLAPVDYQSVLDRLARVPIQQWNYNWEQDTDVPNLGPMAQDFKAAFYPGRDDKGITTLEFDGVELAAIQGLNEKLEAKSQKLEAENAELRARLDKLEQLIKAKGGNGR